jgi:Lipin/Ned1/Smp2 multi-domain protein middle domain
VSKSSIFIRPKILTFFQRAESSLFNNPALVVRIGEQYYKWSAACPIIMSTILYGRTLPSDLVEVIRGSYQEPKNSFDDKMSLSALQSPGSSSSQKKHSTTSWCQCHKAFLSSSLKAE